METEYHTKIALIFISGALISDFFDGQIARYYHQETTWGKILDPIADKILINGIAVILTITRGFPAWLTILIITRDILILLVAILMGLGKSHTIPQSNIWGKGALVFTVSTMISFLIPIKFFLNIRFGLIIGSVILIIISGIIYFINYLKLEFKKSSPD